LGFPANRVSAKNRVGIFMDQLAPGSFPKIAGKEVKYLNNFGVDADLLLIKRGVPMEYRELLEGLDINCLDDLVPIISKTNFKFPGFSFFSLFHVTAPIFTPFVWKEYDIIVAHATYTCFTAFALREVRKIPYLAFIHDPITYILHKVYSDPALSHFLPFLIPVSTKIDKIIADKAEVVLLPSKFHLEIMKRITKKSIEVVYHGVDSSKKIPNRRGDYFIAVARWEPGKKPYFLLDIFDTLKSRGIRVKLLMIGSWKTQSLQADFLRKIRKLGLSDTVKLFGVASETELKKLYLGTRALIHPVTESFGMIGLEAAAQGAPMIIPEKSGVTELFTHGIHGFFPKEGDSSAYLEYIEKLALDKQLAWNMGFEAWKIAKQHTWKSHAEKLENVLSRYLT
jgi:glycosyltransferase involved in cell wall biosynthesis